jgi:hypothetical protein
MSSNEAKRKAEQYLRDQAKIIGRYGKAPKLHGAKYDEAVTDTERTFKLLALSRTLNTK